jgi:hypothetical protein
MTFNRLCSIIALKEGKKSSVKIGDVREILSMILNDSVLLDAIVNLAIEKITKEVNMAKSKAKKTTKTKSKKTKGKK